MKQKHIFWAVLILGFLALLVWGSTTKKSAYADKSNRDLALICQPGGMAENFHIHPQLKIMINGTDVPLPQNIGVTSSCMHPLHTHEDVPNVHVEAPEQRDFTLGDFFAVWNKPFSKDQILDYTVDDQHVIRMTVNGKEVQDYENLILRDKDQIVISYEKK